MAITAIISYSALWLPCCGYFSRQLLRFPDSKITINLVHTAQYKHKKYALLISYVKPHSIFKWATGTINIFSQNEHIQDVCRYSWTKTDNLQIIFTTNCDEWRDSLSRGIESGKEKNGSTKQKWTFMPAMWNFRQPCADFCKLIIESQEKVLKRTKMATKTARPSVIYLLLVVICIIVFTSEWYKATNTTIYWLPWEIYHFRDVGAHMTHSWNMKRWGIW